MQKNEKSDLLGTARRTFSNANRHFCNLEIEDAKFFQLNPLQIVVDSDISTGFDIHKVALTAPLPEAIIGLAFDFVGNLRASLDQACYAIAIASTPGSNGKKAHFPFGKTLDDVLKKKKKDGGSKNIPDVFFDLILESKPYRDGNYALWQLNNLCNTSKHELLGPIATHFEPMSVVKNAKFESLVSLKIPPRWDFKRQEMIIAIVKHGTKADFEIHLDSFLAIGGDSEISGAPAIRTFFAMKKNVESILDKLEEKIDSLGL
ncbi:hypothetical protein [Janthinobacterium sp. SUN120]|uniref:hypothetical protein n=1 Tax=Janthinobacterium sp. SUN120 TaxID=3004099 RepID=UPI0025AF0031|nr:hypothetical protein [Janthinobacterium sp. SUN120]MDN2716085.1 hypothetical protein [Janthinobacterium sp. SUN120]